MPSSKRFSENEKKFPPFDLKRLLETTLKPRKGEKLCLLIDLDNPSDIVDNKYLKNPKYPVQKRAHDVFFQGLRNGVMKEFGLAACDIFSYKTTGGSNLELPEKVTAQDGKETRLDPDIYDHYDLILCIGNYSATAPLTAAAKRHGFRGATMHGLNDLILRSGLAVDYHEVSRETEMLRKGMTHADSVDIDFEVDGRPYSLNVVLGKQEAQKSHGICHEGGDIANLPAGEVYFVPQTARGTFPIKFEEDGTLALMHVENGRINKITPLKGDPATAKKYEKKFHEDPAAGILGELGFGTQRYPFANADIQDEKAFGTFHIATGRNDHLSGAVTKDLFKHLKNATHDDILFSSHKTPEIHVKKVRMHRHGKTEVLIEDYEPSSYLLGLLDGSAVSSSKS